MRRAFDDISNAESEDVVVKVVEEDDRSLQPVEESDDDGGTSEDESDYEEVVSKKIKGRSNAVKKTVAEKKTVTRKKTAAKKEVKRVPVKKSEGNNVTKAKAAVVNSKSNPFDGILDESEPAIKDKDFSNLAGLVPVSNVIDAEDDLGGGDWRCMGAVDY